MHHKETNISSRPRRNKVIQYSVVFIGIVRKCTEIISHYAGAYGGGFCSWNSDFLTHPEPQLHVRINAHFAARFCKVVLDWCEVSWMFP